MKVHWASRPFYGIAALSLLWASTNRAAAQLPAAPAVAGSPHVVADPFLPNATGTTALPMPAAAPAVAPNLMPGTLPPPTQVAAPMPVAQAGYPPSTLVAGPVAPMPMVAPNAAAYDAMQAGASPQAGAPPAYLNHGAAASTDYAVVPAAAQIPHGVVVAAQPFAPQPPVLPPVAPDDVVGRLQQAEQRIKELEQAQAADLKRHQESINVMDSLKERWSKVQDPSITTVDQQTYSSGDKKASEKKWHDRLSIRGYAQNRFNQTLDLEPDSAPAQYVADRSIGDDQNFLIRRARIIISGDVSDNMYVYLQPDFASTPSGSADATYFTQIRDWYADLYIDQCKVHRVRVGQSKVPYGWENMQSSSNRLALDRSDALNSAVRNERDLGIFYYWTPEPAQDFFKYVLDEGLKGSGNYGVFGMGVYNGQGGSLLEQNDDVHFVSRLTIPFKLSNGQCVEMGVQGYIGEYAVFGSPIRPLGIGGTATPAGTLQSSPVVRDIRDERIAASFIYYPQPIGFQCEWNVGRGPALNDAQTAVVDRHLYGGYVQTMTKIDTNCWGVIFPYIRWVLYNGGYKPERNAPFSEIDEVELGTEWQFTPQMELTTALLLTDRTNTTAFTGAGVESYRQFEGSVLRFQFQFNY